MNIKNSYPFLLITLLFTLTTVGCQNKTSDRDLRFVSSYEAIDILGKATGVFGSQGDEVNIWLDPRSPEEYAEGHIPGALSIPFPLIEQDHKSYLRNAGSIVVYDTDWDDVIAVSASKRLMELGYKEVFTLRGGLEAWVADGNPTEKGAPSEATEEQAGRR